MDANKMANASFLDILFQGKNKEYGAYDLRKTYRRRLLISLLIMAAFTTLVFTYLFFNISNKNKDKTTMLVQDIQLSQIAQQQQQQEAAPPPPPPPPPPPKSEPVKLDITKFTPPKVAPDIQVKEPPKTQTELVEERIGTINQEGLRTTAVAPPVEVSGAGGKAFVNVAASAAPAVKEDYDREFTTVQVEAKYPGDWENFLRRNLNQDTPVDNGAPPGNYRVTVSFRVDRDGNVTEVKALNDPGYGTAQEAVRAIKASGKWEPGIQNNQKVISRKKQSIVFNVQE